MWEQATHPKPEGLRARKKRRTLNAIEIAGIELALEFGHDAVTVAQICERADVSRSTFFNYVPTLESAIFGPPYPRLVADEVFAAFDEAAGVPFTQVCLQIIMSVIGDAEINPIVAAKRYELMRRAPETQTLVRGPLMQVLDDLADLAGNWLDAHPERQLGVGSGRNEAKLLVSATGLALEDVIERTGLAGGTDDVRLTVDTWVDAFQKVAQLTRAQAEEMGRTTRFAP